MVKKPKSLPDANLYKSAGRWWNALTLEQRGQVFKEQYGIEHPPDNYKKNWWRLDSEERGFVGETWDLAKKPQHLDAEAQREVSEVGNDIPMNIASIKTIKKRNWQLFIFLSIVFGVVLWIGNNKYTEWNKEKGNEFQIAKQREEKQQEIKRLQALNETKEKAEKGDSSAQGALGFMYEYDVGGTAQDLVKARSWYEKAAAQEDAGAQYNLGVMYEEGKGVPQDLVKAKYWYEKAAAKGYAEAQEALRKLTK